VRRNRKHLESNPVV